MKDEVWHALIVVITNASNLHAYSVRSLYRAVQTAGDQVSLHFTCICSEAFLYSALLKYFTMLFF